MHVAADGRCNVHFVRKQANGRIRMFRAPLPPFHPSAITHPTLRHAEHRPTSTSMQLFRVLLSVAALVGGLPVLAALPPLERNLAYRSPSLTVGGSGLSHDIDGIGQNIARRMLLRRASSPSDQELSQAKDGNAADQLVMQYNSTKGSDGQDAYQGDLTFPYGVASGDPYDDSVILWTHPVPADNGTKEPICLRYEVSPNKDDFSQGKLADWGYAWTTSDVDYSFKVESSGLKPLTQYAYRFYACHDHSIKSAVGVFKTMPTLDDNRVDKLKVAVFSCSNLPFGYFNAYAQAAKADDVDIAMHVGDYIYESAGDGSKGSYGDGRALDRVPLPNKEIYTLDDYRQRYGSYRKDKDLQALHQNKAWILVWDDHEVADNSWKAGTADSNNTAAGTIEGVNFTDRKKNAVKAYYEWMPIRQVDTTDGLRIWRKFQYGKLADIFMLDTRNYDRDITDVYYNTAEVAAMSNDTNRSLMGGKQERWFYKNLVQSQRRGAVWKVVGQQIIVNHLHYGQASFPINEDAWDGYKANRRRMFNTIKANNVDNTLFLAGDSHAAWVYDSIYERWENDTQVYDPATGRGALGVEFAGTAVSSPSSYGRTLTDAQYNAQAQRLVRINRNLQYADGGRRGYFTLKLTRNEAQADFWGFANNSIAEAPQQLLASFNVRRGANHLTRPINGGKNSTSGAVQAKEVDYRRQMWNGTAFA